MPRTGKGGKRDGAPGKAYANRTDLNRRGPEPITTAPGQAYGEATAQREAQQAVPMGGTPMSAQVAPSAQPSAPATPSTPPAPEPGSIPFTHDSSRPEEPVTHGLYRNTTMPGGQASSLADVLESAAQSPYATENVTALANFARQFGI